MKNGNLETALFAFAFALAALLLIGQTETGRRWLFTLREPGGVRIEG